MIQCLKYICLTITAILFVRCGDDRSVVDLETFYVDRYDTQYTRRFSIKTLPDSTATLIRVTNPEGLLQSRDRNTLLILPDSMITPPEEFGGAVLYAPARRIVAVSKSSIEMLEAIEEAGRIVGVAEVAQISNDEMVEVYNMGKILEVGGGEREFNFETLVVLRPDIVLLHGDLDGLDKIISRLEQMGIQYLYMGDCDEETPLARAEWLVALGEVCGVREEAVARFRAIDERYNLLRDSVILHHEIASQSLDSLLYLDADLLLRSALDSLADGVLQLR